MAPGESRSAGCLVRREAIGYSMLSQMISEYLVRISAPTLRFYRNRLNLDFPEILKRVPEQGRLLEVGCFPDLVTGGIAHCAPSDRIAAANHYRKIGYQGPSQEQTYGIFAD